MGKGGGKLGIAAVGIGMDSRVSRHEGIISGERRGVRAAVAVAVAIAVAIAIVAYWERHCARASERWYLGAKAGERAAARAIGRICCKAGLGGSPQSIGARGCRVHLVWRGATDITGLKL